MLGLLVVVSFFLCIPVIPLLKLNSSQISSIPFVFLTGVIGGIVGIQSRLKTLVAEDLSLLASSATFLFLIPIIGGFLALLLFLMLIGGLVQGDLFPTISIPGTGLSSENGKDSVSICTTNGISTLTCVVGLPTDY